MRVLQIHNAYRDAGGEDEVVESERRVLMAGGHQVASVTAQNPTGRMATIANLATSLHNPSASREIRATLRGFRPDVAHIHNTWFALSPSILTPLHQLGIPTLLTLHNYRLICANALLMREGKRCELCVTGSAWNAVRYRCYRSSVALSAVAAANVGIHRMLGSWDDRVDVFIALTEFSRSKFIEGGLPDHRIVVRPPTIADPGPRSLPPSESRKLLFVGRLSPEKGLEQLLRSLPNKPIGGLEFQIIGDGPSRKLLEDVAPPWVTFSGALNREDVESAMLSSRCLLFPSTAYETFGLVVAEAFSAGLPVLASGGGSAAELVSAVDQRMVVADRQGSAWVNAIHSQVLGNERLDLVGKAVRRQYESQWSTERGLKSLEDVYRLAIEASQARSE